MATTRQKIAYNATFSTVAKVVDTFLAVITIAMLTRYLGPSGFGDYSIIFTFGYIFIVLADMGLYSITVREISQNEERECEIISNAFTLRMVSTALIFLIGIGAVFLFPYKIAIKIGVAIAALGFLASFSSQVLMGLFQKNLRIDKASLADLIGKIIQAALILFIIKKGYYNDSSSNQLLSVIAAFSISSFASFIVYVWFARKFVKFNFAWNFKIWKKMLYQGWPLAVSAILTMLYFRLNTITLSLLKGEEAVGIFSVGYKILENLIFFPAMFAGLVMPMMSRAAKEDIARFKDIIHKVFNALIIFLFPLIAATVILSNEIIQIIAPGRSFSGSAGVLNILIFAAALIFLGTLFSNAIIALKKEKQLFKIYFWGAILNLVLNIILIPPLSYIGAAWSTLATEFLVTALMVIYLRKEIGCAPRISGLPKIIAAVAVSSAIILAAEEIFIGEPSVVKLTVLLPASVIIYFGILYFLKGVKKEEFGLFLKRNLPR